MQQINCSILLSVYHREKPEYLRQCLDSVFSQTFRASEIILVGDGPLTEALDTMIDCYRNNYPELQFVPLKKNRGLGLALNEGLRHCHNDLVMRMDTDDICYPNRLELQYNYMTEHPDCDVLGGWTDEFCATPSETISIRRLPEHHADIVRFGKRRNPMNHPTVMFRREAVMRVGGYHDIYLFEDYDLWVRLIMDGARFHNLQQPLIHFRTSTDFFGRRGGWRYTKSEINLLRSFHQFKYISTIEMTTNMLMRCVVRLLPNKLRQNIYIFLLRR